MMESLCLFNHNLFRNKTLEYYTAYKFSHYSFSENCRQQYRTITKFGFYGYFNPRRSIIIIYYDVFASKSNRYGSKFAAGSIRSFHDQVLIIITAQNNHITDAVNRAYIHVLMLPCKCYEFGESVKAADLVFE